MSSLTNNSLLILLLNTKVLKNHVNKLQFVLQEKSIDIALISKTHFTKYSYVHTWVQFLKNKSLR
jgi:hypothetical protein